MLGERILEQIDKYRIDQADQFEDKRALRDGKLPVAEVARRVGMHRAVLAGYINGTKDIGNLTLEYADKIVQVVGAPRL